MLEVIAKTTGLVIDFGGGIKKKEDLEIVFSSGAAFATIGSLAVKEHATFTDWLGKFGADKFYSAPMLKTKR